MLNIRPHHGLCMQNFVGNGYSEKFVENMQQVLHRLKETPTQEICLIGAEDVLCSCCPHHQNGCVSGQKVSFLDREVLQTCGLNEKQRLPWNEFRSLVEEKILFTSEFDRICCSCEWFGLCKRLVQERMENKHEEKRTGQGTGSPV